METGSILRMIAALLGVISAILLAAWLARRSGWLGQQTRRHDLRIQASLALGPRHRLVLVAVEGERMLIGLSPQNIQHLATLPPADATAMTTAMTAAPPEATGATATGELPDPPGTLTGKIHPTATAAVETGAFQRVLNQWRSARP